MSKSYISQHTDKEGYFSLQEASIFQWKSIPKSYEKHAEKNIIFYFMLEMYLLALVITGSVWERFQDPTDSKNHQNSHRISHNPLQ